MISTVAGLIAEIESINSLTEDGPYTIELTPNTEFVFTEAYPEPIGPIFTLENALPVIKKHVVILGNGATFRRTSEQIFRFIRVNVKNISLNTWKSWNLTVEDVSFINGNADDTGGALLSEAGILTIKNCKFINNISNDQGGAISAHHFASVDSRVLEIYDSYFENNQAQHSGGAVEIRVATLLVNGSDFIGNTALDSDGGAICINNIVENGSWEIHNSYFDGNEASHEGGAIRCGGINLVLNGCEFVNNLALEGGAVFGFEEGSLEVVDSHFENNQAESGGAIYIGHIGIINASASSFKNNLATISGGAIYRSLRQIDEGVAFSIDRCKFEGNQAGRDGGALSFPCDSFSIKRSRFLKNKVDLAIADATGAKGGAIHVRTSGVGGFITRCSFIQNECISMTVDPAYGGAIYANENDKISFSYFLNNIASTKGGALYADSATIQINYCFIKGNEANALPNGVYNDSLALLDATWNWWGSFDGPSGAGPGSGDGVSTHVDYDPYSGSVGPSEQDANKGNCVVNATEQTTNNPIEVRLGNKVLSETDLSISIPAGTLSLTRHYRQNKQNVYQHMGLGWSHDHYMRLTEIAGTPNTIRILFAGNGKAVFTETTTNMFEGKPGSVSYVEKNQPITGQYRLTATDKSMYIFDSAGKLIRREWSNGEALDYNYDGSGNLLEVVDNGHDMGSGIDWYRKLVFTYYTSGDHTGQLYRVGDHTFTVGTPPVGRYIEFGYTLSKILDSNGNIVNGTDSLLTSVRDVRGNEWIYVYYGQAVNETDPRQLNFLIRRESPSVDTTGDGNADDTLILEELAYSLQGDELAVNGGMELDSNWTNITGAAPQVNERSTAQVDSGTYSRHVIGALVGQGIEGTSWDLVAGKTYVITAHVYPVLGAVKMQVTGTTAFDRVSSGTGAWQTLRAVYTPTSASTGHRLQFVTNAVLSEFYVDTVSIIESDLSMEGITQERGNSLLVTDFAFQPVLATTTQTTATVDGFVTKHHFGNGVYAGSENPAGNRHLEVVSNTYRPVIQQDAKGNVTWLSWSEDGKHLDSVMDSLGNTTEFNYNTDDTLDYSLDAEGRKTSYVYGDTNNPRQPTEIKVFDTDGTTLLQWQKFAYDANGNTLSEQTLDPAQAPSEIPLQEVVRTYYSVGDGVGLLASLTRKDINGTNDQHTTYFYDNLGRVIQTNQSSNFGTCTKSRTVYDDAGNVVATICNFDLDISGTASASSNSTDAGKAFDEDETTYWSSGSGLVNGEWLRYDFGLGNEFALGEVILVAPNIALEEMPKDFSIQASSNGLLWSVLGTFTNQINWSANEKRVFAFANTQGYRYWRINITAVDTGGTKISIGELELIPNWYPSTASEAVSLYNANTPHKNRVTTFAYDELGRQVATKVNAGATEARTTLTVYDALNRVIRTIANYVPDLDITHPYTADRGLFDHGTDGTENRISETFYNARGLVWKQINPFDLVTLYGYDSAGRQIKVIQNASQPNYDAASDPTLANYEPSAVVGEDLITQSQYDANGNLVMTQDVLGYNDFTVYDELNRVVKTVRRAKANATIDLEPEDTGYNATNDPRSDEYVAVLDADRDIITQTFYDTLGRVIRTVDELGHWTLFGYDALGRQVRTITSASQPSYAMTADPDLDDYIVNENPDEDIVTEMVYDESGRVKYTVDTLGIQTWFAYDGLGHQIKSILNPPNPFTNDPRGINYSPSAEPDEDIISKTVYDSEGRVQHTEDMLGRITRQVYDELGRQVKIIVNYVAQGSTNPLDWEWLNDEWQDGNNIAIEHGDDNDENIITETIYNTLGRLEATRDQYGNLTRTVYDPSGRTDKTIVNYVAQGGTDPLDWEWVNNQWENGGGNAIVHGGDKDQNLITQSGYDSEGRLQTTRDAAGRLTRFVYDDLGRRVKTIVNYVAQGATNPLDWAWNSMFGRWEDTSTGMGNPIGHNSPVFDQNLISQTIYNHGGQVASTRDARGTLTTFTYDAAGRRQTVTYAATTALATTQWTNYDKGGRVLRVINNCIYNGTGNAPDDLDAEGNWLYEPTSHGVANDEDIITEYELDKRGRVVQIIAPDGAITETIYAKDGRIMSTLDPLGIISAHRYDTIRRLVRVVQNYVENGVDPVLWLWDTNDDQWENGSGTAIVHGTGDNKDQNIIAEVTLNKAGQRLTLRDPRGNVTTYTYDKLNRRLTLTNPLTHVWATAYTNLTGGKRRITVTDPLTQYVQQDFDRANRLLSLAYDDPTLTPTVNFGYDVLGNRLRMTEDDGSATLRQTLYTYDTAQRLTQVGFDKNGDTTVDETVSYTYDVGGLRTKLTLPDNKTIVYMYNAQGQLTKLTDWGTGFGGQFTDYTYDGVGRLQTVERNNGLDSLYTYDVGGRLLTLKHITPSTTLAHFGYTVDERGNRTLAVEAIRRAESGVKVIGSADSAIAYPVGTWTTNGNLKETSSTNAVLQVSFFGGSIDITLKKGPDRGICEVFVDNVSWGTYDSYAILSGEATFNVPASDTGLHVLKIQNTANKHAKSSGYVLSFKQVQLPNKYDLFTHQYTYDALARLIGADTYPAQNMSATLLREYEFEYDVAGNRKSEALSLNGGLPTTRNFSYNANNALTSEGATSYTYDNAGRMTTNTKLWDAADRLTGEGDSSFGDWMVYNGHGQRIQRNFHNTLFSRTYDFLLDVQSGLYKILASTYGTFTTRYVHDPVGLHRQQQSDGSWVHLLSDGLGSVRLATDNSLNLTFNEHFAPYGSSIEQVGTDPTLFGFTGEPFDELGRVHLRARYYSPTIGVFPNLDPIEGDFYNLGTLNRYAYVQGNVVTLADPSGKEPPCEASYAQRKFSYIRILAVLNAIRATRQNREGGKLEGRVDPIGFHYSIGETPNFTMSAVFISEMMWRGKLPMVLEVGGTSEFGTGNCKNIVGKDAGWRICPRGDDKITGAPNFTDVTATRNWREHFNRDEWVRDFLGGQEISLTLSDDDLDKLSEGDFTSMDLSSYQVVKAGDSLHTRIDQPFVENNDEHNFFIIGWAKARGCSEVLDFIDRGDYSYLSDLELAPSSIAGKVPYMVDYSYGIIDGVGSWRQETRPRPFYCFRYDDGSYLPFRGNLRYFVTVPDTVTIPADRLYQPPRNISEYLNP